LQRLGRHEEALTALRSGLELRGPEAERAAWIGDSLLALDRAAEARASYEMALERAPRSAAAHAGLARLHQREGELEQALEAGRQAARFQSRQWRYHELLAQLEEAAGNRSAALLAARAAARFAPPWERDRLRAEVARLRGGAD
jgi:tetratricopeptide (TPR) repeat protein